MCLIDRDDNDEVVHRAPALWVEIISPDDRWSRVDRKLNEILRFGVPTVWVIDPYEKRAWNGTSQSGIVFAEDNTLRCERLELVLKLDDILP